MSVKQMHIDVEQGLHQINSSKSLAYRGEELDLVLNRMVNQFIYERITSRSNGGFSVNEGAVDALRTVLVTNKEVPLTVLEPGRYAAILPGNYSYLISDATDPLLLCGSPSSSSLLRTWVTEIKLPFSTRTSPPYYTEFEIVVNGKQVLLPANLPISHLYTGKTQKREIEDLVPWVIRSLHDAGEEAWYEVRGTKYASKSIFIEGIVTSFKVDGVSRMDMVRVNEELKTQNAGGTELYDNALSSSEEIRNYLRTAFWKPSYIRSLSELVGHSLHVYTDKSYTVSKARLSYIKRPRTISLVLGTDCDLPEEFHPTICDMAIAYIKRKLENEKGASLAEVDVQKRTIL